MLLGSSREDLLKVEIVKAARMILPWDSPILPYLGQILFLEGSHKAERIKISATWASRCFSHMWSFLSLVRSCSLNIFCGSKSILSPKPETEKDFS